MEQQNNLERYGTVKAWALQYDIPAATIQRFIEAERGISAKFADGRVGDRSFFAESYIRERCASILAISRANVEGILILNGESYRSVKGWSSTLHLAQQAIRSRVRIDLAIDGFDSLGRFIEGAYYPESHVRAACADLLADVPQCDEQGIFSLHGERYASALKWASMLGLTRKTLSKHLDAAKAVSARDSGGKIQANTYFPESAVQAVKEALPLLDVPQINAEGFIESNGERYGTMKRWAKHYGVDFKVIEARLNGIQGITGRLHNNVTKKNSFLPESVVAEVCANLEAGRQSGYPMVNHEGCFERGGIRYGSTSYWSRILGIGQMAILHRIDRSRAISGKMFNGRIVHGKYYDEPYIREVCEDLSVDILKADKTETIYVDGVPHRTVTTWCKHLSLAQGTVQRSLADRKGMTGKCSNGRVVQHGFFSETVICEVCKKYLMPLPQADEEGFFSQGGKRYGTQKAWYRLLRIRQRTFSTRIEGAEFLEGRLIQRNIVKFYSEISVRMACADLLSKNNDGK